MTPTDADGDVVLRPSVSADLTEAAEVHLEARRWGAMPDSPLTQEEVVEGLREAHVAGEVWVAESEGRVVGYVRFVRPDDERVGWVDDLYVHPRESGRGIGSSLLGTVRALLPEGFGLWVFAQNVPARRFYGGQGLEEVEETDGSRDPEGVPEIRMEWRGA